MLSLFRDKKFIRTNLIAWACGAVLLVWLQYFINGSFPYNFFAVLPGTLLKNMFIFYGNFFLLDRLFTKRKTVYFIWIALAFALYVVVIQRLLFWRIMGWGFGYALNTWMTADARMGLYQLQVSAGSNFLFFVLASGFYWSFLVSLGQTRERLKMETDLQRMEKEKLYAEKQSLQSQVNPHFLYNTLNFLYAKSLHGNPELSDGILTLSAIMKYGLKNVENERGLVLLEDEVTHLRNVVHIHQLRFSGKLQILFSEAGDMNDVEILPFVLITLVENALKHGDWNDPSFPIEMRLFCDKAGGLITFTVVNKKKTGPREDGTGIGLENTISRLRSQYGGAYRLEIDDNDHLFRASLSVPAYPSLS